MATVQVLWQDSGQTATESKKKKRGVGSTTESWVYTPNNRRRPEAPLTSLPKLTPVKNVEDNNRVGGGGEKGRSQNKNHKKTEAKGWWSKQGHSWRMCINTKMLLCQSFKPCR